MRNIKKILVAVCLSPHTKNVFEEAVQMADAFNAKLVLCNIMNVKDMQDVTVIESMGYDVHPDDYRKGVQEERREKLVNLVEASNFPKERAKLVLRVGHPVEQLLNVIKEENVDLVIMGAKGRSNLTQMLVGSVAEKIFRHSPVPVLSYRDASYYSSR